jgi:hypothetical protein
MSDSEDAMEISDTHVTKKGDKGKKKIKKGRTGHDKAPSKKKAEPDPASEQDEEDEQQKEEQNEAGEVDSSAEAPPSMQRMNTSAAPIPQPPPPSVDSTDPNHAKNELKRKMASAVGNPNARPGDTIERAADANSNEMTFPNIVGLVIRSDTDSKDNTKVHVTMLPRQIEPRGSPICFVPMYKGVPQTQKAYLQSVYSHNDPNRPKTAKKARPDAQERFPRFMSGTPVFLALGTHGALHVTYKKAVPTEEIPLAGQMVRLNSVEPKVNGGAGKDLQFKPIGTTIYLNSRKVDILGQPNGRPLQPFEVASHIIDTASYDSLIANRLASAYVRSNGGVPDLVNTTGAPVMGEVVRSEMAELDRAACVQFAEKLRANAKKLDQDGSSAGDQPDREDAKTAMLAIATQLDTAAKPEDVLPHSDMTKDGTPYAIVHRGDTDPEMGLDPRITAIFDGPTSKDYQKTPNTFIAHAEPYPPEEKGGKVQKVHFRAMFVPNKGAATEGIQQGDDSGIIRSRPSTAADDIPTHGVVVSNMTVGRMIGTTTVPHGEKLIPKVLGSKGTFIAARTSAPKGATWMGFKNRSSAETVEELDTGFVDSLLIDVPATLGPKGIGIRVTEDLINTELANSAGDFSPDKEFFKAAANFPVVGSVNPEKATFENDGFCNLFETPIAGSQLRGAAEDPEWKKAGKMCISIVLLDDFGVSEQERLETWRTPATGDALVTKLAGGSGKVKDFIKNLKAVPYAIMIPHAMLS